MTQLRPELPMTPEAYQDWRRQLWSQRGPNVVTPTYDALLPCYKAALERCQQPAGKLEAPTGAAPAATPPPVPVAAAAKTGRHRLVETMMRGVSAGAEEPFYVIDLEAAKERLALWRTLLPNVEPHYAAKCNGDAALLLTLAAEGVGFDCASASEIKEVLALGVPASRIVYANPIKQPSHVRYAAEQGVSLTVFDGEAELHKMARLAPSVELLLRLAVDDSQAQCVLSNKYGAQPADAARLLEVAHELGLTVAGVSFHVGSGSSSSDAFGDAVARAAAVFALAQQAGRPMRVLDVGGGFPGVDTASVSFGAMARSLTTALDTHFPPERGVRIIAEPGRFFAEGTHTLAVSVIGKKVAERPPNEGEGDAPVRRYNYFVNDGLYGSFNCVLYDHAEPSCYVLPTAELTISASRDGEEALAALPCSVWGPTCDGIDCVMSDVRLPELEVGAWLYFPDMGAYTACAGSNFNGMALPDVVYLQARRGGEGGSDARPQAPAVATAAMLRQLRADGVTVK